MAGVFYTVSMQLVGIDEVGRGCWAGPLVAGAVLLGDPIAGLRDSKRLTKRRREQLDEQIRQRALAYGLGWVSAQEIDALGLTAAVRLAYQRALAAIDVPFTHILIDGSYNFLADDLRATTLVKADATVPAVSAASIIAKVARDAFMREAAVQHPVYGFERHVGYGTAFHQEALQKHGPCVLHRQSFRPVMSVGSTLPT